MKTNADDYVNFGDIWRKNVGRQGQYGCRYTGVDPRGNQKY